MTDEQWIKAIETARTAAIEANNRFLSIATQTSYIDAVKKAQAFEELQVNRIRQYLIEVYEGDPPHDYRRSDIIGLHCTAAIPPRERLTL